MARNESNRDDLKARVHRDYQEMFHYQNQNFGRGGNTQGYEDYETGHTTEGFRAGYNIAGDEGSYHSGTREWQEDIAISDYHVVGDEDFSVPEAYDYSGVGPRNYRRPDHRIHDEVCEALTRDPKVDASDIQVEVDHGSVILKGTVDSRKMKREAELVIDEIDGIEDVRNELQIRRPV